MRAGAFSVETREIIQTRDEWRCFCCGSHALEHQIQHRRARGMGGSRRPSTASVANGILMLPSHHEEVERNPAMARDYGYRISQHEEPTKVPVRRWDGWVMLLDDGGLHYLPLTR